MSHQDYLNKKAAAEAARRRKPFVWAKGGRQSEESFNALSARVKGELPKIG